MRVTLENLRRTIARFGATATVLLVPVACAAPERNSVWRARVEGVDDAAAGVERRSARGERAQRFELGERDAESVDLAERIAEARAAVAEQRAALYGELELLQTLEEDLAAAQGRRVEIENELASLRALEQQLTEHRARADDIRAQIAAAQEALSGLERARDSGADEFAARAARLQEQLTLIEALRAQLGPRDGGVPSSAGDSTTADPAPTESTAQAPADSTPAGTPPAGTPAQSRENPPK